ncbi:MAG: hypothetical protein GAK45_00619 [Pseudomonas citronellolis]|nr:MAG: hypothetical protein GAK45_00619 [Pseudomonas citronellolis]
MNIDEQRISEFAYQIWESEGRPQGQAERHWQMARRLAEAEAQAAARQPAPAKATTIAKASPAKAGTTKPATARMRKNAEPAPAAPPPPPAKVAARRRKEEPEEKPALLQTPPEHKGELPKARPEIPAKAKRGTDASADKPKAPRRKPAVPKE